MSKKLENHIGDVNKNVTAVEWLEQEFIALQKYGVNEFGLFEKAKEMEKEQLIKSIDYCRDKYIDSENYYNETFKD